MRIHLLTIYSTIALVRPTVLHLITGRHTFSSSGATGHGQQKAESSLPREWPDRKVSVN